MSKITYSTQDRARIIANYEFLRASGIDSRSAALNVGVGRTTLHRWMKTAAPVISKSETAAPYTPDARLSALESKIEHEIEPETIAAGKAWRKVVTRLDAIEAAHESAHAEINARVDALEHDAQEAHEAAYKVCERLDALEASDTEPTPFHAVDRTYVIVIAIMVITVAITLVTVLL